MTRGDGDEIDGRGRLLCHPNGVRTSIIVLRRKPLPPVLDETGALVTLSDHPDIHPPGCIYNEKDSA
jgi:hypothetical protein